MAVLNHRGRNGTAAAVYLACGETDLVGAVRSNPVLNFCSIPQSTGKCKEGGYCYRNEKENYLVRIRGVL